MKTRFLLNNLLTFVWVALTGTFTFLNFGFGFIISFIALWLLNRDAEEGRYFKLVPNVISFIFYFLVELFKANIQVAYDVITPKFYMTPGIIQVPLDVTSNLEITLLANLITLTPGTLSLDVSEDRKVLYVHAMYIHDKEKFIAGIKNGFERRIIFLLR